jgi:leader peptidase (prepilin peptidase)/N-methyltransferase
VGSFVTAALGVFGVLIGSFLNVVIYRVPLKKSIVSPPSACGSCGHVVRRRDNIPVLSWLILRGRCRDCHAKISIRYPLVEIGGAAFFVVVALWFVPPILKATTGQQLFGDVLELAGFLYLAAISLALALIDLDTRTLPNSIVYPSYIVGAVLLGGAGLLQAHYDSLLLAGVGAVGLALVYFLMFFFIPGGMGFGDVKLAGVLGLFLGFLGLPQLLVGALAAFVAGGLFSIILLVSRRGKRKSRIPFGPWMLLGAWIGILVGPQISTWYLTLFGLGAA